MLLPQNKELLDYWNKVRAGRQAPKRIEIIPSEISSILPSTFILEIINHERLQFRLAGSKMCETFGKEFRSINFIECWPNPTRPTIIRHLSQLINEGTIVTMNCEARSANDHIYEFEVLFLPMTHSGTTIDRILGSFAPQKDYPWIGLTSLEFREINEIHVSYLRGASIHKKHADKLTANNTKLSFLPYKRLVESENCQLRVFEGGKND